MENRHPLPYACWIDGAKAEGKCRYPLINPSTGEAFAEVTIADAQLVDRAVTNAQRRLPEWRSLPAPQRSTLLHALAARMREAQEKLALLVCEEVGKPLQAARDEVWSAARLMDYFAEEGLRLSGRIPQLGYHREQVLVVREPIGVTASITPFNYPLSTLVCKMAPALAVGCTVVAKPDDHTPLSTLLLAEMALDANFPAGVCNVLTGPGRQVGRMLVEHPVPRLIAFTGSTEVGKEIQATSARWVRKVVMELGGHCPAIICADAPWRDLLPQIITQTFKNSGQYCYHISRIYVAKAIYRDFLQEFIEQASRLRVGPAMAPTTQLGPLNNERILQRVRQQVETARREGAVVALGGAPCDIPGGGFYYPPTVLTEVTPEMSIMREEVFGPVVMISSFEGLPEAIRKANASPYGLAAYLFSSDLGNALDWAGRLEAGSVWINRIHQAYPEAPFGGMKESGLGREKSPWGLEEYTELKTLYFSY